MFEKFTDKARRVLVLAQEEARELEQSYVGTEHLLLGLIREGEGIAARALHQLNVTYDEVISQIKEITEQDSPAAAGHIPFTPRAKRVLEGALPLAAVNSGIRAALGALFTWKAAVLLTVIVCSVLFYRPFCKWLCPLGAFYALLNRVSLFQMQVDTHKCVSCGACAKACKMDVDITKNPNHAECIRCGMCIKACPTGAICYRYGLGDKTQTTDKGETI